jgi:OOP family OmpA-OmpF porin
MARIVSAAVSAAVADEMRSARLATPPQPLLPIISLPHHVPVRFKEFTMKVRFNKRSLVALAVFAAGVGGMVGAQAEGLYVGGNVGHTHWSDPLNGVTGRATGLDGKLYGGYQFNPNFSLEAGTMALGHINQATGDAKVYGLFVDAVGTYPLGQGFSLLGRAGLAEARFKSYAGNDTSPGVKVGAGLQYDLTKSIALRGEWEHYRFNDTFNVKPNADQYSVGLKFAF